MIAALVTVTDIPARVPDRLLHGEGREADDARCARCRRVGAALVRIPRQGIRLAGHPLARGCPQLGARAAGIEGPGYGLVAVWLVMSYIWLPYMIIPIYAGLERIPNTLLSASDDLGAKPGYTFRRVILPLVFPAVVAGSIFTFSLTLGDFITPNLVGSGEQFIGTLVVSNFTTNLPFAAAFAMVPIVIMIVYLLLARRFGAFEHL